MKKYFQCAASLLCVLMLPLVLAAVSGCSGQPTRSTVSVSGTGTVFARPDTVRMHISMGKTAQTTKAAQEEVNRMVRDALAVLKGSGIEDRDISTDSLRFHTEYEWGGPRRTLLGQRAEQSISFSVNNIGNNEKASTVIDSLVEINGLELNQMYFTVADTTDFFVRARELAYQKALEKAEQFAKLSGQKVAKALSIREEISPAVNPFILSNQLMNQKAGQSAYAAADDGGSTILPAGELEISSKIWVEFVLK